MNTGSVRIVFSSEYCSASDELHQPCVKPSLFLSDNLCFFPFRRLSAPTAKTALSRRRAAVPECCRKIRHNIRKSLITARDVYAYVRLCYWLREKSRSLCRRSQIKDFSRSGAFGGQYAQIILAHQRPISPSTIYTHWMRYMAAIIIDALVFGKSLGLFKPCE